MKKYLWVMVVAVITALSFQSCSTDDEEENNPLAGTKWVCDNHYAAYIYSGLSGETFVHVFEFSKTTCVAYFQSVKSGKKESEQTLKYEYIDNKYFNLIGNDGKVTPWYFLSPTEICNNQSKSENLSVVYKKQ